MPYSCLIGWTGGGAQFGEISAALLRRSFAALRARRHVLLLFAHHQNRHQGGRLSKERPESATAAVAAEGAQHRHPEE